MNPVTLQINLAPRDFRFAQYLLPHQFRQWGGQVAEILLVIESHRSRGHFGEDWEEGMQRILTLAHSIANARVISVDYSRKAQRRVSEEFFGGARHLPRKDVRGGPFYAYFYGLSQATHNLVLHTDSDMFFGGGSQSWVAEAGELFDAHPEVLVVNPNCSPPPSSGRIEDYHYEKIEGVRETKSGGISLISEHITTRVFLVNKQKFFEKLGPLKVGRQWPHKNPIRNLVWLLRHGGNSVAELPEVMISQAMKLRGLIRLDYLGKTPGMWCLHPPDPLFPGYFELLPQLVNRVEAGDLPEGQRGYYNMNQSMKAGVPA
jgi:hypothetical protein